MSPARGERVSELARRLAAVAVSEAYGSSLGPGSAAGAGPAALRQIALRQKHGCAQQRVFHACTSKSDFTVYSFIGPSSSDRHFTHVPYKVSLSPDISSVSRLKSSFVSALIQTFQRDAN